MILLAPEVYFASLHEKRACILEDHVNIHLGGYNSLFHG